MSIVYRRNHATYYVAYDGQTRIGTYMNETPVDMGDSFVLYTDQDIEDEYDDAFQAGMKSRNDNAEEG